MKGTSMPTRKKVCIHTVLQPFELLEEAASHAPNAIGLVGVRGHHTFLQMWKMSSLLSKKLHDSGVTPRQVVSTSLPPDLDWLANLAVFHEAAIPVSLWGVGSVSNLDVSWFISTKDHESVPRKNSIIIDDTLMDSESAGQINHPRTVFARPDKPMRYVMTSGTTGTPKAVTFTGDNIQARLNQLGSYWTDGRPELNFMGLSTTGGFFTALACLKHRNPYFAEVAVSRSALERARDYGINVLAGSPAQIGQAVGLIREHKLLLPSLEEVRVAGSMPSERLVASIHEDLGVSVKSVYGSTEGGGVAVRMLHPGDKTADVGSIIAGIELEIQGQQEVSGEIRYRGPGVSPGYLGGSSADSSFVDGWFYPGDRGQFLDNGHLVLEGRIDDLLNVGGTKINPQTLEELAKEFLGVVDAAVCLVERVPGIEEVAIMVVGQNGLDMRSLDKEMRAKFPTGYPTVFTTSKAIPRNRMGKVLRGDVRDQIMKDLNLY
jgi:acyl-coenzyme A synthetase/AMP-(fatty) acid ligase